MGRVARSRARLDRRVATVIDRMARVIDRMATLIDRMARVIDRLPEVIAGMLAMIDRMLAVITRSAGRHAAPHGTIAARSWLITVQSGPIDRLLPADPSMPQPWTPQHVVDEHLARALLTAQWPDLARASLQPLGAGWDNTAWLVGGTWVFRFPRREIAVPLLETESRLLPVLAPLLPLAIPVPDRIGAPTEAYPWPFTGYRLLPGRTACAVAPTPEQRTRIAPVLGRFLRALHGIPLDRVERLRVPGDDLGRMDVPRRLPKLHETLALLHDAGWVDDALLAWGHALGQRTPTRPAEGPVLCHGDLYARHLLLDDSGTLSGVIDWGDVHVGDRAVDLAIGWTFLPPDARAACRDAYGPISDPTWQRARFRALGHTAAVLTFAHETEDGDLLREARAAMAWLRVE